MSTPRFYCPVPLQADTRITLSDDLAHYAMRVLRLKDGACITLFDGRGGEYSAQLLCEGRRADAQIGRHNPREAELGGEVRLIQGLPSADKMDWVVEKAVELGAACLTPIAAQRSVVQLRGDRLEKRLQHWRRIAQSASEQCGRNRIMQVTGLRTLQQFLNDQRDGTSDATFLCHPDYGVPLQQALQEFMASPHSEGKSRRALNLMVGPEGGWSDQELHMAQQHGVKAVRFGPRVLRTETAGLALIAASTALLGWND